MFFAAFKSEKNQNWQFGARILDGYLEESVTADSEPSPALQQARHTRESSRPSPASLHVGWLEFSALFVYSSSQPVVPGAADAQQLPVFVELKPLADMRVLNSAPASRGVPLHGSH